MIYLEHEKDFSSLISTGTVLVDFYAEWCGPCHLMAKELEELANEDTNLKIVKIDIDKFPNIANVNAIMAIPTLKVYKSGIEVTSHTGYITKENIKDLLR